MKYLPNGRQIKNADKHTIEDLGVPSQVLMETAARSCMDIMISEGLDLSRVVIVCGTGNNGGDGLALARFLSDEGIRPEVLLVGEKKRFTPECRKQWGLLCEKDIKFFEKKEEIDFRAYSVIVDALFGVGLSRDVEGEFNEIIARINQSSALKVAVDIPSGICADTGRVMGIAVNAGLTVTFQCAKLGMMLYPGNNYCGRIEVADIGINTEQMTSCTEVPVYHESEDDLLQLPDRVRDSHKGTYGKLLIIAGSEGMAGAACLNALSAYRAGAGLVKVISAKANRTIIQQFLPEAISGDYDQVGAGDIDRWLEWADAVCMGSGLGINETSEFLVSYVCRHSEAPILADADAITLMAESVDAFSKRNGSQIIFTPHMGEFSKLTGLSVDAIKKNRLEILEDFVKKSDSCCVLKDSRTLTAMSGQHTSVNMTGNPGMAKAGSGDVLAGVISGFLAQGSDVFKAAVSGVYFHGLSGDLCSEQYGEYSVLARDIANGLGNVMKKRRRQV